MASKTLVVLEPPLRSAIEEIARKNQTSISGVCRDMIKEALEIYEDKYWSEAASSRDDNFKWRSRALTHSKIWGKV